MAVGFRKHAVGWRVRSSAPGGAGTRARDDESMLALMGFAVNACDVGQRVATGGEFRTLAAPDHRLSKGLRDD